MRLNIHKEPILFAKNENKIKVFCDNQNVEEVSENIKDIVTKKEKIYLFSSGDKADFLYEKSCIDENYFNYFSIYNKNINSALSKIKKLLINACNEYKISKNKNIYYISSSYENNFLEDYWYDFGGIKIPVFCGYWFLDTEKNSYIKIENKKINVENGSIVLFEAGCKISFSGINEGITFSLSTLSKIQNQYPQKWMPIIL